MRIRKMSPTAQRGYGINGIAYNPTLTSTGGGEAFSTLQKSLVCNYIIKVK